jgi:chromosome segregation ATPase
MQDKIKYIVFGLVGVVLTIAVIFLGLKVKSVEGERQQLQTENSGLNEKISTITLDNSKLKKDVDSLSKSLEDINLQRTELQGKYDLLTRERDDLANQIKIEKEKAAAAASVKPPDVAPSANDAFLATLIKQKSDLEVQSSMMRETLKSLKTANEQLVLEKSNLAFEVNNLSRDTQDVQRASEYNQKMVDNLTQELAREKTDKFEMAKRLKGVKADNRIMRQQIQSLADRRMSLEKKLSDMQSKNAALESSLAGMELYVKQQLFQMDDIKTRYPDARTESRSASAASGAARQQQYQQSSSTGRRDAIQLPPIVVRPQSQADPNSPSLNEGTRIMSIDRDNNFVVVNAGQANNLKLGDIFQAYRDGQAVGSVEVIQIRDRIAACDIKTETTPLRVGDIIK